MSRGVSRDNMRRTPMRSVSLDSAFIRSKDVMFRDLDGEAVILT